MHCANELAVKQTPSAHNLARLRSVRGDQSILTKPGGGDPMPKTPLN